ncbi:dihydrofolate reductase [Marinilactibacillus sp. Marseille-P9653]|uniref:dihydrofolate reductase n=1 Tax=Marinilactibacillus sp. Marseille-P9653 TaxID=2866583 RepID=UPI001CE492B5|nr:dihydrofolate reductase [Marinilactibacillus sp. Marseille-P9653]
MLTFVWAEDENGVIGKEGGLPWSLPNDMKFFKEVTLTGNVLMGRKTLESIPNPPLKNRINVVLTRNTEFEKKDIIVLNTKDEVLELAKTMDKPLHIIGGADIFNLFVDDVDRLYRTLIHETFEGDVYMPSIDYDLFDLVETVEGSVDEKNIHAHTFQIFERKQA